MNDLNKIMVLSFSRAVLVELGGFNTEALIKILEALPEGTKIRSFYEKGFNDTYCILLSHESFPELPEGTLVPDIRATITKVYTEYNVKLDWPKEYQPEKKFDAYLKSIRVKEQ